MKTVSLPMMHRAGSLAPNSYRADDNGGSVDCVWTTGATVRRVRFTWDDGAQEYDEELIVGAANVRLGRLNQSAPLLDSHMGYSLKSVLGRVIPGSVRLAGGEGVARLQLSRSADDAGTVQKITDGIISNISVGYRVHTVERIEKDGQVPLVRVVDWEPYELSACAVGADAGAGMRSEAANDDRRFDCRIVAPDLDLVVPSEGRLTAPMLTALRMNMRGRLFRVSHQKGVAL